MPAFLVRIRRSGPKWDLSHPLEQQSGWPAHAIFMDARATFARDPWSGTLLYVDTTEPWTLQLDGRSR